MGLMSRLQAASQQNSEEPVVKGQEPTEQQELGDLWQVINESVADMQNEDEASMFGVRWVQTMQAMSELARHHQEQVEEGIGEYVQAGVERATEKYVQRWWNERGWRQIEWILQLKSWIEWDTEGFSLNW